MIIIHPYSQAQTQARIHAHPHTRKHAHTHTCTHANTHTRTHARRHTQTTNTTYPAEELTALASHQVAATVAFDALVAFGTLACVRHQIIHSLAIVLALFDPLWQKSV